MATASEKPSREQIWLDRFRFYRDSPNIEAIENWISLFEGDDAELARKVLDHVMVVSERQIQQGYSAALAALPGWDERATSPGRWRFVGFGKAGESGPAMVRIFREANDLALAKYDSLFCDLSDLPGLKLTALDTVVFIDDFSGTGRQVCKRWPLISELIASEATCHLILSAVTDTAAKAISERTQLSLHSSIFLDDEANVLGPNCPIFDAEEKSALIRYGEKADSKWPEGYGKSGLLFVLSHKTPNNSLPILHVNEPHWRGLFPRYLRAAS